MPADESSALKRPLDGVYVLVVEDYEDARTLYALLLTMHGAHVVAVGSVAEALEAFDRIPFDLLMSDINMADLDGYDLIRRVRARPAESGGAIAALAVTAERYSTERKACLDAGFNAYVPKPFDTAELLRVVTLLLGRPAV